MSPLLPTSLSIAAARPPPRQRARPSRAPDQRNTTSAWAPRRRPGWLLVALALHGLLVWALLQSPALQRVVQAATPLMVSIVSTAPPALPPAPAAALLQTQRSAAVPPAAALPIPAVQVDAAPHPTPPVAAAKAQPAPAPTPPAAVVEAAATTAAPTAATPAAPAAAASQPAAPTLPNPKAVPASALRYAVAPPIEVPMASRRLQEAGTVWLRVVFDTSGWPRQVTLLKSSGFARLDAQAEQAMRQARIAPYLDNGVAVEVLATAALLYELE